MPPLEETGFPWEKSIVTRSSPVPASIASRLIWAATYRIGDGEAPVTATGVTTQSRPVGSDESSSARLVRTLGPLGLAGLLMVMGARISWSVDDGPPTLTN